jgi:site-specific DNA-methyltransferase (adenine-specific)
MIDLNKKPLCTIPRVMCWAVDNIELLKSQPDESVDLIYSDILYGTGRNFGEYQDLKPKRDVIETHYLPRLIEMKRVLKQNGSIYLQMDTRINHWMRILMDKVFGYDNFLNEIVWCYDRWTNSVNKFIPQSDRILFYSKNMSHTFNKIKVPFSDKSKHKGSRVSKFNNGELKQNYVNETRLKDCGDWWNISYLNSQSNERIGYSTLKPKALIERIIKASSNEGDVVADYYLGSGTTAVVCKELNRNFIGCDINPNAIELTKTRLNAGTQPCT